MPFNRYYQPKVYDPALHTAAYSTDWLKERLTQLRAEESDGKDTPRRCGEIDTIMEALQNRAKQVYRQTGKGVASTRQGV